MNEWVDFKELRANLNFEDVLKHYSIEVKRKGAQHYGFCPLPKHNGKRNSPSFSANLERGIFKCFGCGAHGNVVEFAGLMENVDLENGAEFRALALRLKARFCPELGGSEPERVKKGKAPERERSSVLNAKVVVNQPLDFELKGLKRDHPYLLGRGFTPETIAAFELGYCSRGSLKERVAIPLKNHQARLIGYAGRVVDDQKISEDNPRYRLPAKREKDGVIYEFHKSDFLYNGWRFQLPVNDLVIVEGFTAVWWLHQNGFENVVAVMGSDCSTRQAELIVASVVRDGRVWLMPDGNEAGERCAHSLLSKVSPFRFTRWLKLEKKQQPSDLPAEELVKRFQS